MTVPSNRSRGTLSAAKKVLAVVAASVIGGIPLASGSSAKVSDPDSFKRVEKPSLHLAPPPSESMPEAMTGNAVPLPEAFVEQPWRSLLSGDAPFISRDGASGPATEKPRLGWQTIRP